MRGRESGLHSPPLTDHPGSSGLWLRLDASVRLGSWSWRELGDGPTSPPMQQGGSCPSPHPPLPEDQGELSNLWPMIITTFGEPLFYAMHSTAISLILSNQIKKGRHHPVHFTDEETESQ